MFLSRYPIGLYHASAGGKNTVRQGGQPPCTAGKLPPAPLLPTGMDTRSAGRRLAGRQPVAPYSSPPPAGNLSRSSFPHAPARPPCGIRPAILIVGPRTATK